jgi:hypothetical protein
MIKIPSCNALFSGSTIINWMRSEQADYHRESTIRPQLFGNLSDLALLRVQG